MGDIKTCTKCGTTRPVTDFNKHARRKDGLQSQCKSCIAERMAAYYTANRERHAERMAAYREANRERLAEYQAAYNAANRERRAEQHAAWQKANPDKCNAQNSRRKAAKLQATPSWADQDAINTIYWIASAVRKHGDDVQVDHIVPLKSDLVCGLHVAANLQIIPAVENISKGNRFWPLMP